MPETLNQRIKAHILAEIDSGRWPAGTKVPSETQLARQFGASRMTVNRAVRELALRGRLDRVQGLGTFVAAAVPRAPLFEIQSIRAEIEARGETHSCVVLALVSQVVDAAVAARTGLPVGHHAYYLQAVHAANGTPLQFESRYVNPAFAPDFIRQDFTRTTASDYLLRHVAYAEVEHTVDAMRASGDLQRHLRIGADTPCLRLTRRTLSGASVITYVELVHPGDSFKLGGRFPGAAHINLVA